jgi:uncharacterized delta-60 repeat protein
MVFCTDLKLLPDGKLLFAALQLHSLPGFAGTSSNVFLQRLNGDGSVDSSFGDNGMITFDLAEDDYRLFIEVRSDGKINCNSIYSDPGSSVYSLLSRLEADGSFDNSFGVNGSETIITNCSAPSLMLLQNNNKIDFVVTGCDQAYNSIVRFTEDGTIDSTFAENGYLYLPDSIFFGKVTVTGIMIFVFSA